MPIQVEWDGDEKRLIRWNFVGRWTAQELRETIEKSNELIGAQDHTVNHIIDLSQAQSLPANVINEIRLAMRQIPDNLGSIIVIIQGGIIEKMGEAVQHFSWVSKQIHVVRSNAEALAYISS